MLKFICILPDLFRRNALFHALTAVQFASAAESVEEKEWLIIGLNVSLPAFLLDFHRKRVR